MAKRHDSNESEKTGNGSPDIHWDTIDESFGDLFDTLRQQSDTLAGVIHNLKECRSEHREINRLCFDAKTAMEMMNSNILRVETELRRHQSEQKDKTTVLVNTPDGIMEYDDANMVRSQRKTTQRAAVIHETVLSKLLNPMTIICIVLLVVVVAMSIVLFSNIGVKSLKFGAGKNGGSVEFHDKNKEALKEESR